MLATAVIVIVFGTVFLITWLSARAEAAAARCEEHVRHIHHELEIPPTSGRPPDGRRPHRPR